MKKAHGLLILLIALVAFILAIQSSFKTEFETIVEDSEDEAFFVEDLQHKASAHMLKQNGEYLEVYEPLESNEPIATVLAPLKKDTDSMYTLVGDKIFYKVPTSQLVAWMGFDGVEHRLAYTLTNNGNASIDGFVVSEDASKISWSTSQLFEGSAGYTIESKLWTADVDGETATEVHTITFENREAYVLPVRWSDDLATLFFSEQRSGLGGYILFGAWHDLQNINLLEPTTITKLGEDINDIAPNEVMLSKVSMDEVGTDVVALVNGEADYFFSLPAGFSRAGNVLFSPDGTKIAYNIAAGNPDEERFRVILVELGSFSETIVLDSVTMFPNVVRWLDNETLLLDANGAYYLVNADGSGLREF